MKSESLMEMTCPCCGREASFGSDGCSNCQARPIAESMARPERLLPSMGPAFAAVGILIAIVLVFIAAWTLSNDLKVLRVAAASVLGTSTPFSLALLKGDPDLLRYRIFSFDAYRLAALLSMILAPLSLVAIWLSRRAYRLAASNPASFGGRRLAMTSLGFAILLFLSFSAAGISSIPRAIQNGRAKHIAETRAYFYHLHVQALSHYYEKNGNYPQELTEDSSTGIGVADYWGNPITYTPTALIASKKGAPTFSNYQLVSAGPDGVYDTADDIRMIDGVIISSTEDADPTSGFQGRKVR